jgi:hypothetical protein
MKLLERPLKTLISDPVHFQPFDLSKFKISKFGISKKVLRDGIDQNLNVSPSVSVNCLDILVEFGRIHQQLATLEASCRIGPKVLSGIIITVLNQSP